MKGYEGNGKPRKDFRHAPINALVDNWKTLNLTDADFRVLVTLWRKANYLTNRLKGVTLDQLAADMGKSLSRLKESLTRLEKAGLMKRRRGGKRRATEYQLCTPKPDAETPETDVLQWPPECL